MADTIEIIQGTATVVEVAGPTGPQGPAGATGATGATGPAGPAGTGIQTLTTKGDLLSRDDNGAIRVGIGNTGQVLKVSAQGLPSWANESGAVTSVNGQTGAVTVASAQHASEHEPSSPDTIYAFAALVTTDVLALNGVYFCDGATTVGGKDVFFKTGTRKNTKLQYNNSTLRWNLVANLTIEAESSEDAYNEPWGQGWIGLATPTTVSVTRLPLETMVQRLAETGGTATATTSEDGLMSSADKTKLNGIASGAEVNVQANWTEADSGSDAFIQNKPSTFAPSAHSSSHASTGSDPLFDQDLNQADNVAFNGLRVVSAASQTAAKQVLVADDEGLIVGITGNEADARASLGLGTAATAATGDFAAASHTHELTALAATGATNGHVLTANGSNGATFAALPASGVTGAAASASDVLGVSGSNITGVDANADRIVYWNNTSNKLAYGTPADAGAAAASHTHTSADINSQTASNGHVLTANGSGGASFAALPASGISNVDSTLADVMSVSGSNLVADDGGLVDSSNPALVWDDAAGKLVYANPLRRTSAGAFYVGVAPTTTALGTRALCIQADRSLAADRVPTGADSVAIGNSSQAQNAASTAIGFRARANNTYAVGVGGECVATGNAAIAIGAVATASGAQSINISAYDAYGGNSSSATNSVGLNATADLRAMFATAAVRSVYWGGQTTNNTATILNLDATATNRFTIAANTALAVDILLVARRSDVADKWLVARRFLGIRRDGSNNTSLIGTVQNFGMTDQSGGSPTWSFALTADDTNEALQLEVTGATGETVQWRATAIYRVV